MAVKNLHKSLEINSKIPKDVAFVIRSQEVEQVISAHKVILSIASKVFELQFFGELPETRNEIVIVDSSYEAFSAMIEYIYNINCDWSKEGLPFIAEMFYLGEKYQIEDLKMEMLEVIEKYKVQRSNVLEVAILAESKSHLDEFSKRLYRVVARFLLKYFKGDIQEVLKLFSEVKVDPTDPTNSYILHKLLVIITELKASEPRQCINCKSQSCLDGKVLTKNNFVSGAMIRTMKTYGNILLLGDCITTVRVSKNFPHCFKARGRKAGTGMMFPFVGASFAFKCRRK